MHDEVSFLDNQFLVANHFHSLLMYQMTHSSITTSIGMERLRAAHLLVIHMISVLEVMELALLMNIS